MKPNAVSLARCLSAVAMLFATTSILQSQDANWNNGSGGDWNDNANWDTGITPGEGTNAFLLNNFGSYVVDYSTPMTSPNIASLFITSNNVNRVTLNVNTNGFVVTGNITMQRGAGMVVGENGEVSASTIRLNFANSSAYVNILPGASLTASTLLALADQGNIAGATLTNYGGNITAAQTRIGGAQDAGPFLIMGGVNDLGDFAINRSGGSSTALPGLNTGLVVSNGLVNANGMVLGNQNSWGNITLANGIITNTGETIIARQLTANRGGRFTQLGGLFVSSTVRMGVNNNFQLAIYSVLGGTNIVDGIIMGDETVSASTARVTNSALLYIGSGGITSGNLNPTKTNNISLNAGGVFGANADWTGTENIALNGGAFNAASLSDTPHDITLSGVLTGAGALIKQGAGRLTLEAHNTYSGNTLINDGTLALGANASISNSVSTIVGSNTVFDVTAVSGGFVLNDARTLGGFGVVTGDVSVVSGGRISPGASVGTLTLADNLTISGGARIALELSSFPAVAASNDLLVVGKDLNAGGVNNIEISGPVAVGGVYPLIKYAQNFNGTLANFDIVGPEGFLSNSVANKTIYLIAQAEVRPAGNVVWAGKTSVSGDDVWNTQGVTNWVVENTSQAVTFVTGDAVYFRSNSTAIRTNVTLTETVEPASVTADSTADYTLAGSGRFGGTGGITKSNTGKLTVLTTNINSGPAVIAGGVLEVQQLADGSMGSSIGASSAASTNLVLTGGTLRYTGDILAVDRGASIEGGGGTVDISNEATTLTLGGTVAGDAPLTKSGNGTLAFSSLNTYSGGTVINEGAFQANANGAAGSGGITVNSATIKLGAVAVNLPNTVEFNGNCVIDVGNPTAGGDDRGLLGAWSGSGTVLVTNLLNTGRTFTAGGNGNGGGNMAAFSGTLNMGDSSGFLRFNNDGANNNLGSPNATFNLGSGSMIMLVRNGGVLVEIGELQGGPNSVLRGRASGASGTVTYSIGGKNTDSLFEGTVADSTTAGNLTALAKVGSGKLALTGNSTYTGDTLVSSGELQINGFNNSQSILVQGGTLSGNGDYIGIVQIDGGATLSPGTSIGTMVINNSLTMNGNLVIEVNKSESQTSDFILLGGSFSGGGTITVSNLGPALVQGDKFYPFNGATPAGSGSLTVSGAGVDWINNLETDGSIEVSAAVAQPQFGTVTRSGNDIIISGSNGPTSGNYVVLTSTNVATPISSWTSIGTYPFNPDGTFSITNTIVPGTPRLFYTIQVE